MEVAVAKKDASQNGHDRLAEALATLVQNQASFVAQLGNNERQQLEFKRQHLEFERETKERFARIEAQMAEIIRVLSDHTRVLERLTEAVRDKIGFKPGQA